MNIIPAFSLENFKSFGPKQRIPLNKITFLFGPNSQGKSTILSALGILMNGLLENVFQLDRLARVDNSLDLIFGENLINNRSKEKYFSISSEEIDPFFGKAHLELVFDVWNLSGRGLKQISVYQLKENQREFIFSINEESVSVNFNAEYCEAIFSDSENEESYHEQLKGSGTIEFDNLEIDLQNLQVLPITDYNNYINNLELEGADEASIINQMMEHLFFIFDEPDEKHFEHFDWIGPNRIVPAKSFSIENEKAFIKDGYLNHESVTKLNDWLKHTNVIDIGYELVLLDEQNEINHPLKGERLKKIGVKKSDSESIFKLSEVGSGISHLFMILITLFNDVDLFVIEQPELHLHPSMQVQLARACFELANRNKTRLIIETHSEHFIKAAQLEIAKGLNQEKPILSKDDLSVLYVAKDGDGFSKIKQMELDETGAFTEPWPDDFFELSADLSLERLRESYKSRN